MHFKNNRKSARASKPQIYILIENEQYSTYPVHVASRNRFLHGLFIPELSLTCMHVLYQLLISFVLVSEKPLYLVPDIISDENRLANFRYFIQYCSCQFNISLQLCNSDCIYVSYIDIYFQYYNCFFTIYTLPYDLYIIALS